MLRFAVSDDAGALLAIYAAYIPTTVTFEYALPSEPEFRRRIETFSREYPYLVYEEDGAVLGYAYAHRYAERAAYQWGAELSVYLAESAQGRGIGTGLYETLIALLRLQGVRTVYGLVTQPNEKSDRLHASLGFVPAARLHRAGFKNGRWLDVVTYELPIAPYDAPAPLRPFPDADPARVREIMDAFGR